MVRMIGFDDAGLARARERGRLAHKNDAKKVAYDRNADKILIWLRNGSMVAISRRAVQRLRGLRSLSKDTAALLRVSPQGVALEVPKLDMHISVGGLLRTVVLGDDPYQRAGRTRSTKKAAAARINGRKGGRPKRAA